jgi:hypothetical protein
VVGKRREVAARRGRIAAARPKPEEVIGYGQFKNFKF